MVRGEGRPLFVEILGNGQVGGNKKSEEEEKLCRTDNLIIPCVTTSSFLVYRTDNLIIPCGHV